MTQAVIERERLASVHNHVRSLVDRQQFSGIAWCVEQHGKVVERGCTGHADVQGQNPLKPDAIYRIYSMTKPIVSVACLQLVEAGLLRLCDPVSRWIPAVADQKVLGADGRLEPLARPVTIEDLLTHRAGFSYDFLPNCDVAEHYRQAQLVANGTQSLEQLVGLLIDAPLAFQPGTRWHYSYSIDVLARVIECVCNESIAAHLHKAVFAPLQMRDTAFCVASENHSRLASMYGQRELSEVMDRSGDGNQLIAMNVDESYPLNDQSFGRGGHGLYSTIDDFRAFMSLLMSGRSPSGETLLSSPMLNMLWQNRLSAAQMPIDIGGNPYAGYGWGLAGRIMVDTGQAQFLSVPGEGGWSGAASTHFWVDRDNAISGVVMTQYLGSNVPLGADIQALCYGAVQVRR